MDDVLNIIDRARRRTIERNDELSRALGLAGTEPPIGALNIAHQYTVLTLELLGFYRAAWLSPATRALPDAERIRQENGERVVMITKAAFVLSLSACEFSAKEALLRWPGRIAPILGRIYLGKIIKESVAAGRLSPHDLLPWQGIISLRKHARAQQRDRGRDEDLCNSGWANHQPRSWADEPGQPSVFS